MRYELPMTRVAGKPFSAAAEANGDNIELLVVVLASSLFIDTNAPDRSVAYPDTRLFFHSSASLNI